MHCTDVIQGQYVEKTSLVGSVRKQGTAKRDGLVYKACSAEVARDQQLINGMHYMLAHISGVETGIGMKS